MRDGYRVCIIRGPDYLAEGFSDAVDPIKGTKLSLRVKTKQDDKIYKDQRVTPDSH